MTAVQQQSAWLLQFPESIRGAGTGSLGGAGFPLARARSGRGHGLARGAGFPLAWSESARSGRDRICVGPMLD